MELYSRSQSASRSSPTAATSWRPHSRMALKSTLTRARSTGDFSGYASTNNDETSPSVYDRLAATPPPLQADATARRPLQAIKDAINTSQLILTSMNLDSLPTQVAELLEQTDAQFQPVTVDLGQNRFLTLPESVLKPFVERLFIHGNNIEDISNLVRISSSSSSNNGNSDGDNSDTVSDLIVFGCIQLRELHASYNSIATFPSCLQYLANTLTFIDLNNNRLTELPATVGTLANLRTLNISYNKLTSLPVELGLCQQLEHLLIHCNQIVFLPRELGLLDHLREFIFHSNPLRFPTEEILSGSTADIIHHLNLHIPRVTNASTSYLRLPDSSDLRAVAGEESSVTIVACDQFGQQRTDGGDAFSVLINGPTETNDEIQLSGSDSDDGLYTISYRTEVAGFYQLHISLHDEPIQGSPWNLLVQAGRICAERCRVWGDAVGIAVVSQQHCCYIQARDQFQNVVSSKSQNNDNGFRLVVQGEQNSIQGRVSNTAVPVPSLRNELCFAATYVAPRQPGLYMLCITYNGQHVAGSPFHLQVVAATSAPPSTTDPLHSRALLATATRPSTAASASSGRTTARPLSVFGNRSPLRATTTTTTASSSNSHSRS